MGPDGPPTRVRISIWDELDVDFVESDEEARQYDERVRSEIKWKEDDKGIDFVAEETTIDPGGFVGDGLTTQPAEHAEEAVTGPLGPPQLPVDTSQGDQPRDFSRVSAVGTPRLARLTGHSTLLSVPTPKEMTTPLPVPLKRASTSRLRHATLQTPDAVPSPIDSPDTVGPSRSTIEPGTPIPLGTAAFAALKGKKDYQTLTKHFEAFEKTVAKREEADMSASAKLSRTRSVNSKPLPALGGRVFAGLRFCIPPELGQVTKHKQRWDIISRLGGQVTLQPDTAITHVIYDKTSASLLARDLGLQTLTELPEGTTCVRWDWVVNCKLAGKLLDTAMYLSFPKNTLTHAASTGVALKVPSRIMDITDQLRGKSISISKKREHTASDSDTESPRKNRRAPVSRSIIGLSRSAIAANPLLRGQSSIATNHALPSGPGWEIAPEGAQDGLDEMISGVVNGTIEEDADPDDDEGNPDKMANGFRCGQKNDGTGKKGPNEWLAKKFEEMHDLYQGVQGKNPFAIRQYQQAASLCRRTLVPITSGKEALKLKGVGQSIADRIDEFISGAPGRQFYEDNEQSRTIAMFKDVYGVGRTFANELYRRGARSMDDLRTKDFGLTPGQMIGVELYDDLIDRIPREECRQLYEIIRAEAVAIDPKVWIEIMGSYRRGQETSGDVDILITRDTADGLNHSLVLKKLTDRLKTRRIITHDLGVPHDWRGLEAKWMGVGRLNSDSKYRRIDILCIPFEQWGAALIYFTGNEIFNRSLRLYARKKGYSLNQRGLSVGVIRDKQGLKMTEGQIIASRTEQDIFNVLGLRYRHPHHRRP